MAHEGLFTQKSIQKRFAGAGPSLVERGFGSSRWGPGQSSYITGLGSPQVGYSTGAYDPETGEGSAHAGFFPTALKMAYGGESWTRPQLEDLLKKFSLYGTSENVYGQIGQGFVQPNFKSAYKLPETGQIVTYGKELLGMPQPADWDTHGVHGTGEDGEDWTDTTGHGGNLDTLGFPTDPQEIIQQGPLSFLDMQLMSGVRRQEQQAVRDINRSMEQQAGKYTQRFGGASQDRVMSGQQGDIERMAALKGTALGEVRQKALQDAWTRKMEGTKLASQIDLETARIFGDIGLGAAELGADMEGNVQTAQATWLENMLSSHGTIMGAQPQLSSPSRAFTYRTV